jgi:hypothetical protein
VSLARASRLVALVVTGLSVRALAGVAGYDVSASALFTTRAPLPGDSAVGATTDLQVDPSATGTLAWDTTLLTLRYAPQLIVREPQLKPRVLPLHRGLLSFAKRWERASLLLSEDASYGVADIGSLRLPAGSQPTGVFEAQTLGAVTYVRSATFAAFDARPGDRLTLALAGGFLLSGDPSGGAQLPLQYGPAGTGSLRWRVDRRFSLVTGAQASHARFITGAEQSIALATEAVEWQASRTTTLTGGLGLGWTREQVVPLVGGPPPGLYTEALPVALGSVASRFEVATLPVQLNVSARMAPFADRFTGLVYERVEGRASLGASFTAKLRASLAVGSGYAVPLGRAQQAGDSATFGEGAVTWDVERWCSLVGTGRTVFTDQPRLATRQLLWSVSVAAVFRDRDTTSF